MTDPPRRRLEREILAWMREDEWRENEERFERLALALFAIQYERCEPFRRFCDGRGRTPTTVGSWREIPRVPTGAFKEIALRSFPAERTVHTFLTSGTSTERRGALHLDTLELYEASLLSSFGRFVLPDLRAGERAWILALAPASREVPDSSLSHMFAVAARELGAPESGFYVENGGLRTDALLEDLEMAAASGAPVALCGTAFSFVHLLDAMGRRRLALPETARVMETGGFKGRSRRVAPAELYTQIEQRLGVPPQRIVNQYGMTELGSQFYDSVLRLPGETRRKLGPPWARVVVVDPETGEPAAAGEVGAIAALDLANTGSVLALQTADLGRALEGGFEVLGREPGAEARGCSIAADALLSGPPA
ncbi:MAG: acyl-protein synthetase [Myxococcales bacterium]|nr:acyl-protein synthetase [Myxococcales bacterium]